MRFGLILVGAGLAMGLALGCGDSGSDQPDDDGGAGSGEGGSGAGVGNGSGGHGCFETETECDGLCVDVMTHPDHCGECDHPCGASPNQEPACDNGQCASECDDGFVDDGGTCKNFFGAHESWPAECAACNQANPYSGGCSCPNWTTGLSLAVQSDCPGVPMRAATAVELCVTSATSPESDFGGAYQVDDAEGLCGQAGSCRVGNPMAGGACACPEGFAAIGMRSIIRLPCNGTEYGSLIFVCGNQSAPVTTFGGAYQFDDLDPRCRVANPWTGDCSCPAGTVDHTYRVMVDGGAGLYGSTMHLCTP